LGAVVTARIDQLFQRRGSQPQTKRSRSTFQIVINASADHGQGLLYYVGRVQLSAQARFHTRVNDPSQVVAVECHKRSKRVSVTRGDQLQQVVGSDESAVGGICDNSPKD
jgi:hypothetical protein